MSYIREMNDALREEIETTREDRANRIADGIRVRLHQVSDLLDEAHAADLDLGFDRDNLAATMVDIGVSGEVYKAMHATDHAYIAALKARVGLL